MRTDYRLQTSLETVEAVASTASEMMGTLVGVSKVVYAWRRRFFDEVVEGAIVRCGITLVKMSDKMSVENP